MSAPESTHDLHVERAGSGAPVVLVHSSGMSGRQWKRLASRVVERGLRAVLPDLTGHGASGEWPEPRPFSFQQDVAAVVKLLEEEGPAHLGGHSYGAFVALHAAARAPSLVQSLFLYDPVAFGALDPAFDTAAIAEIDSVDFRWGQEPEGRERWLTAFVEYWGGPGAWAALREDARSEFRRVAWVVREGVRTLMEDRAPGATFAAVQAPTLLMTGELSPIAARTVVRRLAEILPNARATTIEGAGHMGPLTHADVVSLAYLASTNLSP